MELTEILQWVIPSGGIGAALSWFLNRSMRNAESAKAVHDAYKAMYEDVSLLAKDLSEQNEETNKKLDELMSENRKLCRTVNRLSRAIEAIDYCPHHAACPVSLELQLSAEDDGESGVKRRRSKRGDKRGADSGEA